MSTPMTTPTVSLIDVSTYLPENRVPAAWYAGHADSDALRDNVMFRAPEYRHHSGFDESNADIIERAGERLVARHGREVLADVDVLLTHSQMPDLPIVGAGGEVAYRLGMDPRRAQRRLCRACVDAQAGSPAAGRRRRPYCADRGRAERRRQGL
jgi:3-oxoacyl-[acyl-carrier-protein] synthase III